MYEDEVNNSCYFYSYNNDKTQILLNGIVDQAKMMLTTKFSHINTLPLINDESNKFSLFHLRLFLNFTLYSF